jgi:hypothetical protein
MRGHGRQVFRTVSGIHAVAASVVMLASVGSGCKRVPNRLYYAGVHGLAASSGQIDEPPAGTPTDGAVVQVGGGADVYEIEPGLSSHVGGEAFIGGGPEGFAGTASLEAEGGPAWGCDDHEHFLVLRGGIDAHADKNPYDGWSALELPTASAGYTYFARRGYPWHIEIVADGSLHLAGAATSGNDLRDYYVRPSVGGRGVAFSNGLASNLRYAYLFHENDLHVIEGRVCYAALFAICGDGRWMRTRFADETRHPFQIGLTVGLGLASGQSFSLTP